MKKTILFVLFAFSLIIALGLNVHADESSVSLYSLSIQSYPHKTVYGAFETLDVSGLSLKAVYSDGSEKIISGNQVNVEYKRDKCLRAGDGAVTLSYGGRSILLPVTVNRIHYDLSDIVFTESRVVYNGKYQSYTQSLPTIMGLDGIPLKISAVGGGINAGSYDVSLDFYTDSTDYLIPESRVVKMYIEPYAVNIQWTSLSFIYDGKSKSPVASYIDVFGKKVYPTVIGAATNANQGYIAAATSSDPNYRLENAETLFEIKKADYDFSGVYWSADSFVYDGSPKSVTLLGLPSGVSVIGYRGHSGTEAGKYTAKAELDWDKNNYNSPPPLVFSWEIEKADYDISGFSFVNAKHVYDGKIHYPTLEGKMPVGADGIMLEYSFSAGAYHVDDGVVSVIISFKSESKNYNIPKNQYSCVSISPKGITVVWGDSNVIYTGERQSPTVSSSECAIKVVGEAITVGRYTAKAVSDSSDYYIINDSLEYVISKAENRWVVNPEGNVCYEGREIRLRGESLFGEISYVFYSDKDGKEKISTPTLPGKYYAVLEVADTVNYSGIRSDIIEFEIVKIQPVSFVATINKPVLRAFELISYADISCAVVNNDGSEVSVDSREVEICYENGSCLSRTDESVTLKYGKYVFTLPITVDYAQYDLSGISWENAVVEYNGKEQLPTLKGLPNGIKIIEYKGEEAIDVGSYNIFVVVEYDSENYIEPKIPSCNFTIEPKKIDKPSFVKYYNGLVQIPDVESEYFYLVSAQTADFVGEYQVTLSMIDSKNYVFSDTNSNTTNAIFEILPCNISIKIADLRLGLFEKMKNAEYIISYGKIFEGDIINLEFYNYGGKVMATSNNPNYLLQVEAGKIIRLPYPSLSNGMNVLLVVLTLAIISLLIYLSIQKRAVIARAFAVVKCRWHHRNFSVPSPTDTSPEAMNLPSFEENKKDSEESDEPLILDGISLSEAEIDSQKADNLITDSLAKSLLQKEGDIIYTEGTTRAVIDIGVINDNFERGDRVDINSLKKKGLVPKDTAYLKIRGEGAVDRALIVYSNEFSLTAVKMIALCGGKAIKCITLKGKPKEEKE